jgi:hypothetical protein
MMALMHRVRAGDDVPKEPSIWLKIHQFLDIMPQRFEAAEKQARYKFSLGHAFCAIQYDDYGHFGCGLSPQATAACQPS